MPLDNVETQSLGAKLLAASWLQGTLFHLPSVQFGWNTLASDGTGVAEALQIRTVKNRERLVVISQDCDINKNTNTEPFIEAMICSVVKNRSRIDSYDRNSVRWFVIDPNTGLIAEAKYRLTFAKELFFTLTPEPWPSSPGRLERFVRWLGRRYDRPAIPNEIVDVLHRPVEQIFTQLDQDHPDLVAAFNRAVHEIRVTLPLHDEPPFDLQFVLLTRSDGITEEELNAIDAIMERIGDSIDPGLVDLETERVLSAEEMSLAEYRETRPLFLEYLSYSGDEISGAVPYGDT